MPLLSCIAGTTITIGFIFIVVGIPTIIKEVMFKPRGLIFTVENASVSGFNLSSDGHITALFNVVIRVDNPTRKVKLKYSHVRVFIFKSKQNVANDALHGFTQPKENVTLLWAKPIALNVPLKKEPGLGFGLEIGSGYIDVDVVLAASLNGFHLMVTCRDVRVRVKAVEVEVVSNANSTSLSSNDDDNGHDFRHVECDVRIYRDSLNLNMN